MTNLMGTRFVSPLRQRRLRASERLLVCLFIVTSLWLWVGFVAPARRHSALVQQEIGEARAELSRMATEEGTLKEILAGISVLEKELAQLNQMLWLPEDAESVLFLIDTIAGRSSVHIESFSAAAQPAQAPDSRWWMCEVRASFSGVVFFLKRLAESERIVGVASITIRSQPGGESPPPRLRVSLQLFNPTLES